MQVLLRVIAAVTLFAGRATAEGTADDEYIRDAISDALYFINACDRTDLLVCLKERVLKYIDQLPETLEIRGVVKIKRQEHLNQTARPDELPEEPRAREIALDRILTNRIMDFVSSHSVEFRIPRETVNAMRRSLEEEGRKKKGKKGASSLFLLFFLKLAVLGAIAMKVLTLIAFKALVLGKIALTISGVIALKKLFEQKHTSTYEVIAHPQFEDYSHHDRSFAQDLSYRRQDPFN